MRRYSPTSSWHSITTTANSVGPFAMWTAFPPPDYYGPSAPLRHHQPTVSLPAAALAERREGQYRNGSHVHCMPVGRIGAQLCRYSLATTEPAALR